MLSLKDWSPRSVGIAAAVVTVGIWAAFIVIARASAHGSLTPYDIALARIVGASLVLLPWGAWRVARDRFQGGAAPSSFLGFSPLGLGVTAACGFFGGFAYALLAYSGFFFAPAAHAAVLMPGSLPLWTTLVAMVLLGTPVNRARLVGLCCIVAGDLLVGGASLLRALDGGEVWKGDLFFVSAAFCWSTYSVLTRRHGLDPVRATTAITVFAFFSYVPLFCLLQFCGLIHSQLAAAPWHELLFQALFQGVGSVVISGITFVRMVGYFGPIRSTMITALVPGLSTLGAVVLLGEPLQWNLCAGLVLVTLGIIFGVRKVL